MGKDERFVKIYSQGKLSLSEIFVDKVTGVNYLFRKDGYGAGLCVLVDKDGKPVISSPAEIEAMKR